METNIAKLAKDPRVFHYLMETNPVFWANAEIPSIFTHNGITSIDPWQQKVLMSKSRHQILNCTRQAGKSTIASVLALHTSIYRENHLTLLVSRSQRQSSELFKKVKAAMQTMRSSPPPLLEDNALSCTFTNGSRIVCLPDSEATIRGFSGVGLLIEDEASLVSDALYYSTRPMLAVSGGRHVLMSTPRGKRGHFYKAWCNDDWERTEIPATQIPRITPEFLASELAEIGEYWYKQEYMCQFVDTDDAVFPYDLIEAAMDDNDDMILFPELGEV